eukprot:182557_1
MNRQTLLFLVFLNINLPTNNTALNYNTSTMTPSHYNTSNPIINIIKTHNKPRKKRSSTKDALSLAPAPVLRQHTLASSAMYSGPGMLVPSSSTLHDVDMLGFVDRFQATKSSSNNGLEAKQGAKSKIETIYSFIVEALSTA